MRYVGVLIGLLWLAGTSCTSDPKKPPVPTNVIEDDYEDEDNDQEAVPSRKSAKVIKVRVPSKVRAALKKTYRVPLKFDKLVKAIENATGAIPNVNSIYEYDLIYDLFPAGNSKPQGQAVVLAKTGDKYFTLESKGRSKVRKHLYYGKKTEKGFCGACFWNMDQIHFQLGIAYYLKRGKSSGFFATDIKFLRDEKGATRILPGVVRPNRIKSKFTVVGFKMNATEMELVYRDTTKTQFKLVIKLNRTLDSEVFFKPKEAKEFKSLARYYGGVLPPYAAKQE